MGTPHPRNVEQPIRDLSVSFRAQATDNKLHAEAKPGETCPVPAGQLGRAGDAIGHLSSPTL